MTLAKTLPLVTLLSLCGLTACASTEHGTPASGTSDPLCLAISEPTFSKNDTPETKEEIRAIRAAWERQCLPPAHP